MAGRNVWEGGVLVEWEWWTVEFGDAYAGAVGVLVDGGEPEPVYFDVGSGSQVPSTTHWSAYDGRHRHPRAEALRAVCACGWRGAAEYPLDWATIGDQPVYETDVDLTGPLADWDAHLSLVRDKALTWHGTRQKADGAAVSWSRGTSGGWQAGEGRLAFFVNPAGRERCGEVGACYVSSARTERSSGGSGTGPRPDTIVPAGWMPSIR
ncbi:hypothetical protein ACFXB3_12580 [Streptomyces sp. NPDC059447]|uniref:hypothetical protein n=1 Tax=Streptomyces sp. NPDC059447 TaxID=3346834 RepID=UPI00368CC2A3